ncbi:MAG TPA: response regulator, partial [Arenimonas sp.]|nr:response regulator [Arenimonas sp.]
SGQASGTGLRNTVAQNYHDLRDGSLLLVGKAGAIDRFWPSSGQVQPINTDASAKALQSLNSVLQDSNGAIWLGNHQGLLRIDPAADTPTVWNMQSSADPALLGPVTHLRQSPDGLIWAAFYGGGLQARDGNGRIVHSVTPKSGQGLRFPDPEQLFIGPDQQLWLAGGEGVLAWNPQRRQFAAVKGAPGERVFSAYFSPPQTLWLGRLGGLDAYHWQAGELTPIRSVSGDEGLPAVEVTGINADGAGALWLSSARGLMRYSPVQNRVRVFGINDGLISQEFAQLPPYIGADGQALALSGAGLVGFNPRQMSAAAIPLRLVIERISVRREEDVFRLDAGKLITLQPDDRDLSVDALLLNFDDVSAHRYRSRLSGYDPDWVEMGTSGKRVFSKLPAGEYRLELMAANAEGVWSKPVRLAIDVLPPLWKTWWAYASYVLALALLVGLIVNGNRQRLKRRYALQLEAQQQDLVLKSSEAKSQFLANLGHEIRTPMTGVLGMAELLLAGELPDRPKSQVAAIKKAGEHLLRLMNDALDLSKIEAGQFELDNQPFQLQAILLEVQALLSPLAVRKGLHFELQMEPEVNRAYLGDCGRIRQILLNLGSNAIKFTDQGFVIIKAQRLWPKGLMLSVVDSGPGMNQEQQHMLFRRFVQADGVRTSRQFGGSGLGLAISREFAVLMDGDIQVSSEPGHGSTFTLNLPLELAADNVPAVETAAQDATAARSAERILLVEDDETIVLVVSELLAAHGHQVVSAKNALEALALTAQNAFDVIFCDVDLPGMSGLELTRVWRKQGVQTPVIALTARTQADVEALCLEAGMSAFLRKPVSGRQLQQAVATAVGA